MDTGRTLTDRRPQWPTQGATNSRNISRASYYPEKKSEELAALLDEEFGDEARKLMERYNPDYISSARPSDEQCCFGASPTIKETEDRYGTEFVATWIVMQLSDLTEYCGIRDKSTPKVMHQLASVIAVEYGYLRLTEILLFLHRFKAGRFLRFYGSIDPLIICDSLKLYLNQKKSVIAEHYAKLDAEERMERERRMREEYEKRKEINAV